MKEICRAQTDFIDCSRHGDDGSGFALAWRLRRRSNAAQSIGQRSGKPNGSGGASERAGIDDADVDARPDQPTGKRRARGAGGRGRLVVAVIGLDAVTIPASIDSRESLHWS